MNSIRVMEIRSDWSYHEHLKTRLSDSRFENAEARISRVLTMQNIERIESTNSRLSRPLTVKRVEGRKEGRKEGRACPVAERNRDRQIARQYFFFWKGWWKNTHIYFFYLFQRNESLDFSLNVPQHHHHSTQYHQSSYAMADQVSSRIYVHSYIYICENG